MIVQVVFGRKIFFPFFENYKAVCC